MSVGGAWIPAEVWQHRAVRGLDPAGRYVVARLLGACDAWGRMRLDVGELADLADVPDDLVEDVLEQLARGRRPFLHAYGDGAYALVHGWDRWATSSHLRDRPLPSLPEPPQDLWEAAGCSPMCRASRDSGGMAAPGRPGWYGSAGDAEQCQASPDTPATPAPPAAPQMRGTTQPNPIQPNPTQGCPTGQRVTREGEPGPLAELDAETQAAAETWLRAVAEIRASQGRGGDMLLGPEHHARDVAEQYGPELARLGRADAAALRGCIAEQLGSHRSSLGRGRGRGPVAYLASMASNWTPAPATSTRARAAPTGVTCGPPPLEEEPEELTPEEEARLMRQRGAGHAHA